MARRDLLNAEGEEKRGRKLPGRARPGKPPEDRGEAERTDHKALARSFLSNSGIPPYPENEFIAGVLFSVSEGEGGAARVSALKLLLDWGGHLKGKGKGEMEEDMGNLSQQDALRLICENLVEMGITREQMEKWMS